MASFSPISSEESSPEGDRKCCGKSRKCSKGKGHVGKCDSKRQVNRFWETSPIFNIHKERQTLQDNFRHLQVQEDALSKKEQDILALQRERDSLVEESERALQKSKGEKETLDKEISEAEETLRELKEAYEKVKKLLEQKDYSRRRRSAASTSYEMINDYKSSTRYRRREETKNILEFIHGGFEASLYGAWDFLAANASNETMTKLMSSYKRGRFLQGIFERAINDFQKSEEVLKQSVALKYQSYLSRRKYNLVCKTQSSFFNAEKEVWLPRNIKCLGVDLRLPKLSFSDDNVDKFVKSLDIGHVTQIPGVSGVSRTVTDLVFMIIDLHLRVPHLSRKLVWFNENENHFIFQFSDDGAPETNELTMSIGSMVCWNFGDQVRSRDFQYLLHCVSVKEKDQIMHDLWKQHTEEMKILEAPIGNRDGDVKEGQPQKTLLRVSDIDSVGERARKQEMLQKSEEDLKQYLQKTGFPHVRHATGEGGCGLGYLASRVKEHFSDETNRYNKLPVRLIGNQAIALARYYYRLVDTLENEDETEAQTIQQLALSKIGEYLRNAGGLFNRIETNSAQVAELKEMCSMYFNLMSLFFSSSVNVTTWTIGYAIPYHANLLFTRYGVGYGIVSLQAKEAKHSGVKEVLTLTNRSNFCNATEVRKEAMQPTLMTVPSLKEAL